VPLEIHITDSKPSPWKEVLFHGFFLALFIMAIVYFKERLYSDSGYYVAHMVDSGFFYIGNQRLVLALSQVVPLIVMAMGFGLKSILIAYSIGNVLFFYVLFLIVLYKYKDEVSALLLILLQVVGTTWIYFSPMIEICYGAALLVLFYCILTKAKLTPINIVTLIILEIFILTSHPENFILFFFVLAAEILRKGFRKKIHPILISVFIALIIFKSFTFGNYEGGKLNYMFDLKQNHLYENLFKSQYISSLVRLFTTYYPELVVMFIFVVFAFVKRKAYSLLSLFIITILGFIALVNATNYAGEYGRYNEALYFPVVLMISITFMIDVFKVLENKWRNIILIGLSIAFIERMVTISSLGNYLSMRTDQMENIIQTAHKKGISKCIITLANSEEGKWALNWSYPMESLLI
jgi:hypothetical protein